MTIVFAILLFSFLIFVHELGHFLAAKASRVQVNEFAIFMGPAIFKKKVGNTLYSLRCIPIGGFCAMEGEDADTDSPHSFQKASWWKRLIILVAGSGMNFIVGFLLMLIVFAPAKQFIIPVIAEIEPGSSLNVPGGFQEGDRFLEIDGEKVYVQSDFQMLLSVNPGKTHDFVVQRGDERVTITDFPLEKKEFSDANGNTQLRYGFSFATEKADFGNILSNTAKSCANVVRSVRLSLQMLFSGQAGFSDISGPVGIVQQMSDVADQSETWVDAMLNLLYFGGFLAINLAVMNLLPIPALDGGRGVALVLTVLFEKITRRKIDPKYEGYLHGIGMILLLGLMALIMFKDIFTIFKG